MYRFFDIMFKLGEYCNSKPPHSYEYALNFSTYGNALRKQLQTD